MLCAYDHEEERDLMFPDWQLPYFVALAPGSPETLHERVDYAEKVTRPLFETVSELNPGAC